VVAVGSAVTSIAVGNHVIPTVSSSGTWQSTQVASAADFIKVRLLVRKLPVATSLKGDGIREGTVRQLMRAGVFFLPFRRSHGHAPHLGA
jgi:hypothetical protein